GEPAFASELRALPRGEIDLDALEAFLAFNSIPAPLTIFREIRKLPPGQLLTWEDGRLALKRFARPAPIVELREDEEAELVEELRSRVRDSVRAHLVSDVPVGVLLSGGVDSAFLAALAAEESSESLRTFWQPVSAAARVWQVRSSSGCRRRRRGQASTTRRSVSSARCTCRRSSATMAGRRSFPRSSVPSSGASPRRSIPSTSFATDIARPLAPTSSRGCRTSTSGSTSSTTCW